MSTHGTVASTPRPQYLPSPREIREACRQIRKEWSTTKRESRRVNGRHGWTPMVLSRPVFDRRTFDDP
jgi:hypothetical protein